MTKPRQSVLQILAASTTPLSAKEVHAQIEARNDIKSVDLVSVYRILETLHELELVHQVFPSGGYMPCLHQTCASVLHVLTRCSQCEEISEIDVPPDTLAPILWFLREEKGFAPDTHMFQMNGICAKCGAKK